MEQIVVKRFDQPDQANSMGGGQVDVLEVGGVTVARAEYPSGWSWKEHIGKASGQHSCLIEHVCMVMQGEAGIRMDDGTEKVVRAGDVFYVAPGHDFWVIGDRSYVSLHFLGARDYVKKA